MGSRDHGMVEFGVQIPMAPFSPYRFLIVSLFLFLTAESASAARVVVRVPADTPAEDSIYFAGSLPSVGAWKADGVKLARREDGSFTGDLDVPVGQTLEFKITRGSWETVEKNADGSERANRSIVINNPAMPIDVTVERWASAAAAAAKASTVVGTLKLHTIDSAALKQSR